MKKQFLFLFLSLMWFLPTVKGQIQADFSADTTTFCPPRLVQFNDQSTGSGIIYRHWTFSPTNQSIGNQLNPSASYTTPGSYDVTLTISNGVDSSTITKTNFITVWQSPVVSFSSNSTLQGCIPVQVQFQNTTQQGDAPITAFQWTFGDNSSPNAVSAPNHTYNQAGLFTVTLIATDQNGCSSSKDSVNMVTVFPSPSADFSSAQSPHNCQTPHTVNYVNLSTGGGLSYQWDLGNGSTSSLANPTETYVNPGVFDIQLIVTDTNGCADTAFKPQFASATATVADFTFVDSVFCLGEPATLINTSVGGSNARWNFGNGSPIATTWNGSNTYSAIGTYPVTLQVFSSATCRDTITKNITIQQISADFAIQDPYGCEIPHSTNFFPQTSDSSYSYFWEFGNNSGTSQSPSPGYNYTDFGLYTPKLTLISPYGCVDSVKKVDSIYIFEVIPEIIVDGTDGCAPITVQFINASTPKDSLVSAFWDFDDSTFTATGDTVFHTFQNPGTYFVWLTVATADSCLYQKQQLIEVGAPQVPDFIPDSIIGCASDSNRFWNLSTDTSLITGYRWIFSDGQVNSNKNPVIQFKDTGMIDVKLVVDYNGCQDTLEKKQVFRSLGPTLEFIPQLNCQQPLTVQFNGNIIGADSIFWDFGDSLGWDTNSISTSHTYNYSDDFPVVVTAKNLQTGCENSFEQIIKVRNLQALMQATDTLGCKPLTVGFNGNPSVDNLKYIYDWWVNGVKVETGVPNFLQKFSTPGIHLVELVTMDINNCVDTAIRPIYIFEPKANFLADTTWGCGPFKPQFTDLSTSDTNIVSWDWDFGNGTTSAQQNPIGNFNPNKPTSFSISLSVTDTFGCKHDTTFNKYVFAHVPRINIKANQQLCANDSVSFQNTFHHPANVYQWNFGNGNTSTDPRPTTNYLNGGFYDVFIRVSDSLGCIDTADLADFIHVEDYPNPLVTANPKDTSCYPAVVRFNELSLDSTIQSSIWYFGDSSSPVSSLTTPLFHTYLAPGKYSVKVVATTAYGCTDSTVLIDFIDIEGPSGVFALEDDSICTGEEIPFIIDSAQSIYSIEWDFGDGNDSTVIGTNQVLTHSYNFDGKLLVRAIARDSSLNCPTIFEDTVYIHEMEANFQLDTNAACIPFNLSGFDLSVGATSYEWNILGDTVVDQPVSTLIDSAGEFTLSWLAKNRQYGCVDTTKEIINVYPLPDPQVKDEIHLCIGDSMELTATDGIEYRWSPFTGLSEFFGDTVKGAPIKDVAYTVVVKDRFGCINNAKTEVFVIDTPSYYMITDTVIDYGTSIILWVESPDSINVVWFNDGSLTCEACLLSQATPLQTTTYPVTIADYNGCFQVDTNVTLSINESVYFFIPNAFSPNGDGINDEFKVIAEGYKSVKRFQIFDRWGQLIFETTNLSKRWNGTRNGNPIDNTNLFNYILELERFTGEIDVKQGTITLVR